MLHTKIWPLDQVQRSTYLNVDFSAKSICLDSLIVVVFTFEDIFSVGKCRCIFVSEIRGTDLLLNEIRFYFIFINFFVQLI